MQKPTLEDKVREWRDILSGDDVHSISNQVTKLVWDAAVFRVVRKSAELSPKDEVGNPQVNGIIFNRLNNWYLTSQTAALRRLADRDKSNRKDVASLYLLLKDIQTHAHLITREALFALYSTPYDIEKVDEAYNQWMDKNLKESGGMWSGIVPEELVTDRPRELHILFDQIALTKDPASRATSDQVSTRVISRLLEILEEVTGPMVSHVDKFIAHAATADSRANIDTFTYGQLWQAEKRICSIFNLLHLILTNGSLHLLPYYPGNLFLYIDKPIATEENIPLLEEEWDAFDKEVNDWSLREEIYQDLIAD